ncbi:hypothetical protein DKX38_018734 [Salix brachista]|uniref:Uncharacterized protein n=1 Tax=Salix brachista TaxID=2182728 RepID=A0A5N5KNU3_9ROSI|nr:hypothetical protein DKX38_018734 [Salix brachista]
MSAPVNEISFEKATLFGFQRFQGANLNYSRIAVTVPIVTSIVPGAGPFRSSAYVVRFYLPVKFQADPPVPIDVWNSHCVAVAMANVNSTASNYSYSNAQYDSPFQFIRN